MAYPPHLMHASGCTRGVTSDTRVIQLVLTQRTAVETPIPWRMASRAHSPGAVDILT